MLEVGALTTITPDWVAALTSTLSSPTPARATTLSRPAAASASASTLVAERTRIASTSAIAGSSSARSAPLQWRISKSGPSASTVAGLSSSAMSTTGLLTAMSSIVVRWIRVDRRTTLDRRSAAGRARRCARAAHDCTGRPRANWVVSLRGPPVRFGSWTSPDAARPARPAWPVPSSPWSSRCPPPSPSPTSASPTARARSVTGLDLVRLRRRRDRARRPERVRQVHPHAHPGRRAAGRVGHGPAGTRRRDDRLAAAGRARPRRVAARLRPPAYRRRRGRPRPCTTRPRRSPTTGPAPTPTRRTPRRSSAGCTSAPPTSRSDCRQWPAQVGLDVARRPATGLALRRPGGARGAGGGPAQQVRRAAARRADQQPRRPRPRADGGLRHRPRGPGAGGQPRPRVPRPGRPRRWSSSTWPSSGSATTRGTTPTSSQGRELAAPAGARGVRGVRRGARPPGRAVPATRRLGGEGPAPGRTRRRAGQAPAGEVPGPRRPPGRRSRRG